LKKNMKKKIKKVQVDIISSEDLEEIDKIDKIEDLDKIEEIDGPEILVTAKEKVQKIPQAEDLEEALDLLFETDSSLEEQTETQLFLDQPSQEGEGVIELDLAESLEVPVVSAVSSSRSVALLDPVAQYISEIKKYPLLTRQEETALAKHYYETQDPKAAQRLVTSNLRFVVKIATEYAKFGPRLIDLIQEGNIGLLHAVRDYNPYKGVRLISYAVWWIRGYIQEYLMKQYSLVKIGTTQSQKKLFYRLQKEKETLEKLTESGDYTQLSEELGIQADDIKSMAQRLSGRDLSLSATIDSDSGASFLDFQKSEHLGPEELLSKKEELQLLRDKIKIIRADLSPKEILLLEERLLSEEPVTLQDIANRFGITREAVRQSEVRLLAKLRALFFKDS
jgi:RNA polymerase sigma-32 factor